MFCAKTHNMGFVSPTDNKTPIVPLQGAALRDRALPLTQPLQAAKKGYAHTPPHAACPCFSYILFHQ